MDEIDKNICVDFLEVDPKIKNQKYCLLSFLIPHPKWQFKVKGVKVRGCFETEKEAREYSDFLSKKETYSFNIYIGDVGYWVPFYDDPNYAKEGKYANDELNSLMKENIDVNEINKAEFEDKKMKWQKIKKLMIWFLTKKQNLTKN